MKLSPPLLTQRGISSPAPMFPTGPTNSPSSTKRIPGRTTASTSSRLTPASQTRRAYSNSSDLDAGPAKPNLSCIGVDLLGVFYGLKLFIHFARKTRRDLSRTASSTSFNPKMVITTAMAGQYPFFTSPQYTAAKHGCVGLVRSAAPILLKNENIALNCVIPTFVDTNIMPEGLVAKWPKEHVTRAD
jgi:hypothetical protein